MKQKNNMTFTSKTKIKKSTTTKNNTKKLDQNIPEKERKKLEK